MAKKKTVKKAKGLLPPVGVKKINPRGASVLIKQPTSKKKVGMYGLI